MTVDVVVDDNMVDDVGAAVLMVLMLILKMVIVQGVTMLLLTVMQMGTQVKLFVYIVIVDELSHRITHLVLN